MAKPIALPATVYIGVQMGIKKYKPNNAGRRNMSVSDFAELTKNAVPEKNLLRVKRRTNGRNNQGIITVRHRGGGHKRQFRLVDFRRNKDGVEAVVLSVQYDPNRSARIALLRYIDGERRYIVAPDGLDVGAKVLSGAGSPPNVGNCLPLSDIPLGAEIHSIELQPNRGGVLCRSAGSKATLVARDPDA
ncbi:MAG: 50S ribosomal protein L2, partial [Planctomycetaceae bacterium]|nr:50S ribosomal protein L2 [Planctomycetaceae bacterium]